MKPNINYRIQQVINELKADVSAKNMQMQFNNNFGSIEDITFTGAGVTVTNPTAGVLLVDIPGGSGGGGGMTAAQVGARMALGI